MDSTYTNGVIAVKEKSLLGDRIKRLCECSADDAFRQITEYGFGYGAEAVSSRDFEALIAAEERAIDEFIRRYAPSRAEPEYLFFPRDFHNAAALVKAEYLSLDVQKMLAPEGTVSVGALLNAVRNGETAGLGILGETIERASALFKEEEHTPTGVEIGTLFLQGQFRALKNSCKNNGPTRSLLAAKADMTNLLTAFRSKNAESAEALFVEGGKLTKKDLLEVYSDAERVERAFHDTPYLAFVKSCLESRRAALPFTQAERMLANSEIDDFSRRRFALSGSETFLYYVLRRRLECDDVRIIFVCLNAGMAEADIKKRLRSIREGL